MCLLAAACGGGGDGGGSTDRDYIETTRTEFLAECRRDGGDDTSCTEQLECIEQELTQEEYVQMDLDEAAGFPAEKLTDARAKCASP